MTPQLEAAIAAIHPLSITERQQLIQILIQNNSEPTVDIKTVDLKTDLKTLSTEFRRGITLNQLRTTQTATLVHKLKDLAADFWPEEDSIEDFLAFLRQQRQEVI
jgi:hypothetical protein